MSKLVRLDTPASNIHLKKSPTGFHDEIQFENKFFTGIGIRSFEVVQALQSHFFKPDVTYWGLCLGYELFMDTINKINELHEYTAWFNSEEEAYSKLIDYRTAYVNAVEKLTKELSGENHKPRR